MDTRSETIISGEMHEKLRKAGLADDYVPVPKKLEPAAKRLLAGRQVASFDNSFRKRLRYLDKKRRVAAGNRRHETAILEARERMLVNG